MDLNMILSEGKHQHSARKKQLETSREEGTALDVQQGSQGPGAKKQPKWSPDEDERIIQLRTQRETWEDIGEQLPGRSPVSCRLSYQNYLERNFPWDEAKKTKFAKLYNRLRAAMWSKVAEEIDIPWRALEEMHWEMGKNELAMRAGVKPFSHNPRQHSQSQGLALPGVREVLGETPGAWWTRSGNGLVWVKT
ncbi:hypothetical protein PV05_09905 [Exophiala xenobiotica]|uniref:Myb-like domain-containing protein n=1 Tax=Exophiala xenobiotica TaxID=348802 RepID=A0A0D2CMR0_9EURO|nr:uncharacterized protein PV05_09905 [Exophiala xenobiotica]KIW51157.1 hypothetical protein PV05_09905 [Exophiala xenobiotica]